MKIKFLGACSTVTGSKYLLTSKSGCKILIDCGLFQGLKTHRLKNWNYFPVKPEEISAIILSHAHIDHSGYIPKLFKDGFKGDIFCSHATRALSGILLIDSGKIQEEEASYANRKAYSKHHPAQALYTSIDATASLALFRTLNFHETVNIDDFSVKLIPSGHILGASSILVEADGKKILFSGDLGRYDDLLMDAPHEPVTADYLVCESTYGDRNHIATNPIKEIEKLVSEIKEKNSVLLLPSFAVGRAQTLILLLYKLFQEKPELKLPIYLNSPMAKEVTRLYEKYSSNHKLSKDEAYKIFKSINIVSSIEQSQSLNEKHGPMIIISASGMLTGGRILHHLEAFGANPNNILLLAGFQAEGTRGADIKRGIKKIKFHGSYHHLKLKVESFDFLSAHADQKDLIKWLSLKLPKKKIFLTHGEALASEALRKKIQEEIGQEAYIPYEQETINL